jgi:hypothetical protein
VRDHPARLTGGEIGVRRGRTLFHLRGDPPDGKVWPEPIHEELPRGRAFDSEAPVVELRPTVLLPKTRGTGTYPRDARVVRDRYGVDRVDSALPDPVINLEAYTPPAFRRNSGR